MTGERTEAFLKRVRAMHTNWETATNDLDLDQINHHERPGVLPIAFSLLHFVTGEDRALATWVLDQPAIWESETDRWPERVGPTLPSVRRGTPVAEAEQARFRDIDSWRTYQTAVFTRTEDALAHLQDDDFNRILVEEVPESMHGGFLALLAGNGPVLLGDLLDAFVLHHGIRHLGELEHARSLVGLHGVS